MTLDAWARNFGMPFDPPRGGEDAYFEAQEVAEGFVENGGNGNATDITEYLTGFGKEPITAPIPENDLFEVQS